MNILEKIIAYKRKELAVSIKRTPVKKLESSKLFTREIIPLTDYILNPAKTGIIAEFKRKSPSKGIINRVSEIEQVTSGYCHYGASGISVLTDNKFFGGSSSDLLHARAVSPVPILRKDFIIDEYHLLLLHLIKTGFCSLPVLPVHLDCRCCLRYMIQVKLKR